MKKYLIVIILLILNKNLFSQDASEWENCTEGLNNTMVTMLNKIDSILFNQSSYTYFSTNFGKQWHTIKYYDNMYTQKRIAQNRQIIKFKNKYIMFGDVTNSYISEDLQNWETIKFDGFNKNLSTSKIFSTDSTIIRRIIDGNDSISKYRTIICREITYDSVMTLKFQKIPGEGEIVDNNEGYGINFSNVINYFKFGDTLFAIYYNSSKQFYYRQYFYSTDYGWSWKKVEVNIQGGIKSLSQINGKLWILSPFAIWRPKEDGSYEKLEDAQFDNFNTDFLIEHKGLIYAQAIDSSNHKPILVRSIDNGTTWESIKQTQFTIKQLISDGNYLIASSQYYGVLVSTDDGKSWEERNNGLYNSPDYLYEGPWKKIVKINDNEYITSPRNTFYNVYMKSYDGGRTWQRKFLIDSIGYTEYDWTKQNYKFTFSKNKYGLFAVDRGSNKTYISYDKGESWEYYSDGAAFYLDEDKNMYERNDTLFYFYNSRSYATDKFIYYTLDTGRTWVMYDSLFLQKLPEKSNFLFVKEGIYYAFNNQTYELYKSINDGKIWESIKTIKPPTKDSLYQIYTVLIDENQRVFIFGYTKSSDDTYPDIMTVPFYITNDDGKIWKKMKMDFVRKGAASNQIKFLLNQGKIFLLYMSDVISSLYELKIETGEWINISGDLDGNIITDILAVDKYLYISTIEGLFRMKVDAVGVKEEVEKVTLQPMELYPNPASEKIQIKNNYYNLTNVQVYDIYGREQKISNYNSKEIELGDIQSGVYIVKMTFDNSWIVIKKIVKM